MKVKAKAKGFYNSDLKQPGDVFEVKDDAKASWFEPIKQTRKKASKKASKKAANVDKPENGESGNGAAQEG